MLALRRLPRLALRTLSRDQIRRLQKRFRQPAVRHAVVIPADKFSGQSDRVWIYPSGVQFANGASGKLKCLRSARDEYIGAIGRELRRRHAHGCFARDDGIKTVPKIERRLPDIFDGLGRRIRIHQWRSRLLNGVADRRSRMIDSWSLLFATSIDRSEPPGLSMRFVSASVVSTRCNVPDAAAGFPPKPWNFKAATPPNSPSKNMPPISGHRADERGAVKDAVLMIGLGIH